MTNLEQKVNKLLIRRRCDNFRLVVGGTLILYFEIDAGEEEAPKTRLWIECAWRLRDSERILLGSLDNPDVAVDNLNKIRGCSVMEVRVDDTTRDLRVTLADGFVIECFSYFLDGDVWEVRQADGYRIGVGSALVPFERFEKPD